MNQRDIKVEDLNRQVQSSLFESEAIVAKAIESMNEAQIPPDTAAIDLILFGFAQIEGALPETQFNILALAKKIIEEHESRLEAEGHKCNGLWPELMEGD